LIGSNEGSEIPETSAHKKAAMTVQQESKATAAAQATAMPSAAVRIPINNVKGGGDYTGQIKIGSQGVVANVILDTGSSTLAVVPRIYQIAHDTDVKFTSYAQQVSYGTGGWSGPVIQTSLSIGSAGQEASVTTYMAIADDQLPNNFGPADGILGLAFNALNSAFDLEAYLTSERVHPPVTYPWPFAVSTSTAVLQRVAAFLDRMGQEIDLTPYFTALEQTGVARNIFAFYTLRSVPNMASANPADDPLNNGIFVLGGGLEQTDLYNGEAISVDVLDDLYYNTNLKGVQVGDGSVIKVSSLPAPQAKTLVSNSIIDSGTNSLVLAPAVYGAVVSALRGLGPQFASLIDGATSQGAVEKSRLDLTSWPSITFVLQGETGADVSLTCAPNTYWQTDAPQPGLAMFQIQNGGALPQSILGLPLFNNYYTVFDRTQDPYGAVRFAPIAPPAAATGGTTPGAR
jgi:Eukaryotic aspartyl protease